MLPNAIQTALSTLTRSSESIHAVAAMMNPSDQPTGDNRFTAALESLQSLSKQHGIAIAIVGGLGAIRYGYPAATEDIDVVIGDQQLDSLIRHAPDFGFKVAWRAESGWHTLMHRDVEINIVPEGRRARNDSPTTIPGPVELGVPTGLDYATLPRWLELKISSGRRKDLAHVVEVLKQTDAAQIAQVQAHLTTVHPTYRAQLDELIDEAIEEKQQEKER